MEKMFCRAFRHDGGVTNFPSAIYPESILQIVKAFTHVNNFNLAYCIMSALYDAACGLGDFDKMVANSKSAGTRQQYKRKVRRIQTEFAQAWGWDGEDSDLELEEIDPNEIAKFVERESKYHDGSLKSAANTESYRNALIDNIIKRRALRFHQF